MKVTPLSSESLGCRSMATFVETKDCKVLIDPGASIPPLRFELPPHPLEHWCLKKHRERIFLFAQESDFIIITHFDETHFTSTNPLLYKDKILLIKNPNQHIHVEERNRAFDFMKKIKGIPREITYIDGRTLRMGDTVLGFSDPIPHGGNRERFVIHVSMKESEDTFMFSSDVEGILNKDSAEFLQNHKPTFFFLDGPMIGFQSESQQREPLDIVLGRIMEALKNLQLRTWLIDHHLLRDTLWHDKIMPLYDYARQNEIDLKTVAEYRGEDINLLEARRKELFKDDIKKGK